MFDGLVPVFQTKSLDWQLRKPKAKKRSKCESLAKRDLSFIDRIFGLIKYTCVNRKILENSPMIPSLGRFIFAIGADYFVKTKK